MIQFVCMCFPTIFLPIKAVHQGEDLFAPDYSCSDLIVSVSVSLRRAEDAIRKAIGNFHLLAIQRKRCQRVYMVSPLLLPLHF